MQKFHSQQAINHPLKQDLEQALTCCVIMLQQVTYAQEIKELLVKQ